MNLKNLLMVAAISFGAISCETSSTDLDSATLEKDVEPVNAFKGKSQKGIALDANYIDQINAQLELKGLNYQLLKIEYITSNQGDEAGQEVLRKDLGNKQLGFDFVPFDARRGEWSGPVDEENDNITFAIDQTDDAIPPFGGLTAADTDAVIVRSFGTWEDASCSNLDLTRYNDYGIDIGLIAFLNGLGGSPYVFADVQNCGFTDIDFGGGILGVTFTFGFTDANGDFTDVDNNGKADCAFREIYYDPSWNWADDGTTSIDLESVATHEIGHGLSQAHFGNIAIKHNGYLQASPRAVMNALYSGPYRDLNGTDKGGHCSNWGQWPQN